MDLLASEYSWGFRQIMFDTYPEDFFLLQRQITMRKIDEHLMHAAIVANPLKEPESAAEFIENLLGQRRYYRGEVEVAEQLDVAGFDNFRETAMKDSNLIKTR